MMMEDSVRPSIQATMVGGTVNLVERSVLESCRSLFSDYIYHSFLFLSNLREYSLLHPC